MLRSSLLLTFGISIVCCVEYAYFYSTPRSHLQRNTLEDYSKSVYLEERKEAEYVYYMTNGEKAMEGTDEYQKIDDDAPDTTPSQSMSAEEQLRYERRLFEEYYGLYIQTIRLYQSHSARYCKHGSYEMEVVIKKGENLQKQTEAAIKSVVAEVGPVAVLEKKHVNEEELKLQMLNQTLIDNLKLRRDLLEFLFAMESLKKEKFRQNDSEMEEERASLANERVAVEKRIQNMEQREKEMKEKEQSIEQREMSVEQKQRRVDQREKDVLVKEQAAKQKHTTMQDKEKELELNLQTVNQNGRDVEKKEKELELKRIAVEQREKFLAEKEVRNGTVKEGDNAREKLEKELQSLKDILKKERRRRREESEKGNAETATVREERKRLAEEKAAVEKKRQSVEEREKLVERKEKVVTQRTRKLEEKEKQTEEEQTANEAETTRLEKERASVELARKEIEQQRKDLEKEKKAFDDARKDNQNECDCEAVVAQERAAIAEERKKLQDEKKKAIAETTVAQTNYSNCTNVLAKERDVIEQNRKELEKEKSAFEVAKTAFTRSNETICDAKELAVVEEERKQLKKEKATLVEREAAASKRETEIDGQRKELAERLDSETKTLKEKEEALATREKAVHAREQEWNKTSAEGIAEKSTDCLLTELQLVDKEKKGERVETAGSAYRVVAEARFDQLERLAEIGRMFGKASGDKQSA